MQTIDSDKEENQETVPNITLTYDEGKAVYAQVTIDSNSMKAKDTVEEKCIS